MEYTELDEAFINDLFDATDKAQIMQLCERYINNRNEDHKAELAAKDVMITQHNHQQEKAVAYIGAGSDDFEIESDSEHVKVAREFIER